LYSQPLVNFFNNLVITPKPFPTDRICDGTKEVEIRVRDLGCMVGGEEPSICFVIASYVFILVFKEYFNIIFVTSNSTEIILQGF
jgi:hypothetical protein